MESRLQNEDKDLRSDAKLMGLLRDAIAGTENKDGWANLSSVGSHISNQTSFDAQNYGYPRLSDLVKAIGLFQVKRDENKPFKVKDIRRHSNNSAE